MELDWDRIDNVYTGWTTVGPDPLLRVLDRYKKYLENINLDNFTVNGKPLPTKLKSEFDTKLKEWKEENITDDNKGMKDALIVAKSLDGSVRSALKSRHKTQVEEAFRLYIDDLKELQQATELVKPQLLDFIQREFDAVNWYIKDNQRSVG